LVDAFFALEMKVYIAGIDTPIGHNLAMILSQTAPASRAEEPNEEEEGDQEEKVEVVPEKPKEPYIVTGSFHVPLNESVFTRSGHVTKPGRMVETGDKQKDAARREAIQKIPVIGKSPPGCSKAANGHDKEAIAALINDADVIVVNTLQDLEHANWVMDRIHC
jgi:adenylate kinase